MRTVSSSSVAGLVLLFIAGAACGPAKDALPPVSRNLVTLKSPNNTFGTYQIVAATEEYLYASAGSIHIFELKSGADATEVGVYETEGVSFMAIRGTTLFFVDGKGANVADISTPSVIKPLKVIPDFDINALQAIRWSSTQNIVASTSIRQDSEIILFDVSAPANTHEVGRFVATSGITSLTTSNNIVYVTVSRSVVQLWDIANVAAPKLVGSIEGRQGFLFPVAPGVLYGSIGIANPTSPTAQQTQNGILDARDPTKPKYVPFTKDGTELQTGWNGVAAFAQVDSWVFSHGTLNSENGTFVRNVSDVLSPKDPGNSWPFAALLSDSTRDPTVASVKHITSLAFNSRFLFTAHVNGANVIARY